MCRFVAYLGPPISMGSLITEPSNSLIHQSYQNEEREEPLNGDGFGLAWYEPQLSLRPGLFRSVSPAWNNRNLQELARMTVSPCMFGHVRAASRRLSVSEFNCHPFVHGRYAFMHNGDVTGFESIRRPLLELLSDEAFAAIQGTTDSEHLFALFLDQMRSTDSETDPCTAMTKALTGTIQRCLELCRQRERDATCFLNLAVTDGRSIVATRFISDPEQRAASLHLHVGHRYVCEEGVCRMVAPADEPGSVIVSSERLSDDPGWETVPVNSIVAVRSCESVSVTALSLG